MAGCTRRRGPGALASTQEKEQAMANITRFNPFNDFDDVFKGLFVRPMVLGTELPAHSIKVDIARADDGYTVKAELPGIPRDDIHVAVDGSLITISGEVKKGKEEKKGKEVIHSERYYGKVSRSFTLPQEVDEAKVAAKYADGVLDLTLPLKARAQGRKIAVS
jgi:HSP20 family protein